MRASTILFSWSDVLNKFLGDATKAFFGGGRIPLDQRPSLVELHAEGIYAPGEQAFRSVRARWVYGSQKKGTTCLVTIGAPPLVIIPFPAKE